MYERQIELQASLSTSLLSFEPASAVLEFADYEYKPTSH